jgi:hypothetical protein
MIPPLQADEESSGECQRIGSDVSIWRRFLVSLSAIAGGDEKSTGGFEQGIAAATCSAPKRWRSKFRSHNCNRLQRVGALRRCEEEAELLSYSSVFHSSAGKNRVFFGQTTAEARARRCPES